MAFIEYFFLKLSALQSYFVWWLEHNIGCYRVLNCKDDFCSCVCHCVCAAMYYKTFPLWHHHFIQSVSSIVLHLLYFFKIEWFLPYHLSMWHWSRQNSGECSFIFQVLINHIISNPANYLMDFHQVQIWLILFLIYGLGDTRQPMDCCRFKKLFSLFSCDFSQACHSEVFRTWARS